MLPDATGLSKASITELVDAVAPRPYLITGGRALQEHRLTDQHFFRVVTLVPSRVGTFAYRQESAFFVVTARHRIWGWVEDNSPHFATAERAIIDSISSSRYGVSLSQAITALSLARTRDGDFLNKLLAALRRYGSDATSRRVGLLVERTFGSDAAEPFLALIGSLRSPVPLRPGAPAGGRVDPKWRVLVNASTEVEAASV